MTPGDDPPGAGQEANGVRGAEAVAQRITNPGAPAPAAEAAAGGAPARHKNKFSGKMRRKIVANLRAAIHFLTDQAGNVYRYETATGAWAALSEQVQDSVIFNFDNNLSPAQRVNIIKDLRAATTEDPLQWGRVADSEIPCANGILDVLTWELRPHAPSNRLERSLPVNFISGAKAPVWEAALDRWFPADKDGGRRAALQEFFGYITLAHAKYKRAAILKGETNTGKSVAVMAAKALVGDRYTCQLGVEHMADAKMLVVLKGKALNVLSELSYDSMIKDGGFKTLVSTEEPITLNGKYVAQETYTPTAKHLIATNNLPRLNDHTSATFNRLLLIPFKETIAEADQDRTLLDKLKAELPGILLWAAEGAARLVRRHGQWPHVEAASVEVEGYRRDMNPLRQFAEERLVQEDGHLTPTQAIARAYNAWNTGGRNLDVRQVTQKLKQALGLEGQDEAVKSARYDGRVISCLHGFRLVDPVSAGLRAGEATGTLNAAGEEIVEAYSSQAAPAHRGEDID